MDMNKHDKICEAYWKLHGQVQADPEYARMLQELEELTPRYEDVLKTLPEETQTVIERYILIRESMNSRMLEYACGELLFPEM